jgi:hypothetical protein
MLRSLTLPELLLVVGPDENPDAADERQRGPRLDTDRMGRHTVTMCGHQLDIDEDCRADGTVLGWTLALNSQSGVHRGHWHLRDRDQVLSLVAQFVTHAREGEVRRRARR